MARDDRTGGAIAGPLAVTDAAGASASHRGRLRRPSLYGRRSLARQLGRNPAPSVNSSSNPADSD